MKKYQLDKINKEKINAEIMISKIDWKELCDKYDKWCYFNEVEHLSYEQAEEYIKNMPVFLTM